MDFLSLNLSFFGHCIVARPGTLILPGYQQIQFDQSDQVNADSFLQRLNSSQIESVYNLAAIAPGGHCLTTRHSHWELATGIRDRIVFALRAGLLSVYQHKLIVPPPIESSPLKATRQKIKAHLQKILQEERAEAMRLEQEHSQRNFIEKAGAEYWAYSRGFGKAAWGLLTSLKEINDVVSPQLRLYRMVEAAVDTTMAEETGKSWGQVFQHKLYEAEQNELIEALGFDYRKIDKKLMAQVLDVAMTIWKDEKTQQILVKFAKDYIGAQHRLEMAEFSGGVAFEVLITALLAAFTGGVGAIASLAGKINYVGRLKKLGELFLKLGKLLKHYKKHAFGKLNQKTGKSSGGPSLESKPPAPPPIKINPDRQQKAPVKKDSSPEKDVSDSEKQPTQSEKEKADQQKDVDKNKNDDSGNQNPEDNASKSGNGSANLSPDDIEHINEGEFTSGGTHKGGGHGYQANRKKLQENGYTEISEQEYLSRLETEKDYSDALKEWNSKPRKGPNRRGPKPRPGDFGLPEDYKTLNEQKVFYMTEQPNGMFKGGVTPAKNSIHKDGKTWFPENWGESEQISVADHISTQSKVTDETVTVQTDWVKIENGEVISKPPTDAGEGFVKVNLMTDNKGGKTLYPDQFQ